MGDRTAFGDLVIAYRSKMLATISRIIGRPEDAEDVAQEVCMRLYNSLNRLKTADSFDGWLYRLTVNTSYDYLRKRRRRKEARLADLSEGQIATVDAAAGNKVSRESQRLQKVKEMADSLLQSISERDRILLMRRGLDELSVKQLAKIYAVDETTIKVRLFRARQRVLKIHGNRMDKLAQ